MSKRRWRFILNFNPMRSGEFMIMLNRKSLLLTFPEGYRQCYLRDDDGRYAVAELFVEGFVTEEVHGQQSRRRASQRGEEEQRGLGDTTRGALASLAITDGLPLVEAVDKEGQQVDREEVV